MCGRPRCQFAVALKDAWLSSGEGIEFGLDLRRVCVVCGEPGLPKLDVLRPAIRKKKIKSVCLHLSHVLPFSKEKIIQDNVIF